MTNIPPPVESYVVPVTWKDRLAPSWPAALGLAMVVIGASNAVGGMVILADTLSQSMRNIMEVSLMFCLPSVMLLAAGLYVLTRNAYARVFCLMCFWATVAVSVAIAAYIWLVGLRTDVWVGYSVAAIGWLLLPGLVMLWMAWAPVRREMQCWSRRNLHDFDNPAKAIGWHLVVGWILIVFGLGWAVRAMHPVIFSADRWTGEASLDEVPFLAFVILGLLVSGMLLLMRNRVGATAAIITAIAMLYVLVWEAHELVEKLSDRSHRIESFDITPIVASAGRAIIVLWWFLRPGVRAEMAGWKSKWRKSASGSQTP